MAKGKNRNHGSERESQTITSADVGTIEVAGLVNQGSEVAVAEPTAESAVDTAVKEVEAMSKPRKPKSPEMTNRAFLNVYIPLAVAGKTAREIGEAMGRSEQFVTQKAANIRKQFKEQKGYSDEKIAEYVPPLSGAGRGRTTKESLTELEDFVKGLLSAANQPENAETQKTEATAS